MSSTNAVMATSSSLPSRRSLPVSTAVLGIDGHQRRRSGGEMTAIRATPEGDAQDHEAAWNDLKNEALPTRSSQWAAG